MAIPFFDIRTHGRKPTQSAPAGHTADAALAYRAALVLVNCRTGERHDYTHRAEGDEVHAYGIETPRPSPLAVSEQALADAIEKAEHRKDSRLLRALIVSIPPELDDRAKEALIKDLAGAIAEHLDTVAAWALHPPSASGDGRNWHGHIVIPTRVLSSDGQTLAGKMEHLDNPRTSGDAVAELRNLFADKSNEHLAAAELDVRIDPGRILEGVPVESASSALVADARRASEKRKGRAGRGIRAAASITAAVANGDITTDDARRFVDQHRARRQWNRSGGRTRYETRARSRRSRDIIEPAIQRRDPALADAIITMMRGDTAPVTTQREQAGPARTSFEERRAARGPRRRRNREPRVGAPAAGQDVAVATAALQRADDQEHEPTRSEGRTRRARTHARLSLEERREQRPPRRRRRSTTASATGKESSAGPVAASTTEAEPTPSPSRSRRRRVRDETPRAAPEPGPDPTPIRMREIEDRIAATQRAADAYDEENRAAIDARVRAREQAALASTEPEPQTPHVDPVVQPPQPPRDETRSAPTPGPEDLDDQAATGPTAAVPYDEVYEALPGQIAAYAAETARPPTPEEINRAVAAMRDGNLARQIDEAVRARIAGHDEEDPATASEEYPALGLSEDELADAWSQGAVAPAAAREAARQATAVADEICKHAYGHERDGQPRRGPPPRRQWPGRTRIDRQMRRRQHIDRSLAGWIGRALGWIARILVRAAVHQIDADRDAARSSQASAYSPAPRTARTSSTAAKPPKDQPPGRKAAQPSRPVLRPAEHEGMRARAPRVKPTTAAEPDRRGAPRGGRIAD